MACDVCEQGRAPEEVYYQIPISCDMAGVHSEREIHVCATCMGDIFGRGQTGAPHSFAKTAARSIANLFLAELGRQARLHDEIRDEWQEVMRAKADGAATKDGG